MGDAHPQDKNGSFVLSGASEWRITPIYPDPNFATSGNPGLYYSQDAHLNGMAAGFDLRKRVYKWVSAGYGVRFKYGHLAYDGPPAAGFGRSINAWTADHLFFVHAGIPVGEAKEIRIAFGHGLMNRGSDFALTVAYPLSNGQAVAFTEGMNFNYSSDLVSMAYSVDRLEAGVVAYYSGEVSNFRTPNAFVLLAFTLKYDLWRSRTAVARTN
jgi:hypothetical protein